MPTKKKRIVVSIAIAIACIFVVCLVWSLARSRPETKVYAVPFPDVVAYLNESFGTNVTACISGSAWAWGPSFLSTNTVYWIETDVYVPEKELKFKAWFSQIGAEHNTFHVQREGPGRTSIAFEQDVKLFISLPFGRGAEHRILKEIERNLGMSICRSNPATSDKDETANP